MKCNNCGNIIDKKINYCPVCGKKNKAGIIRLFTIFGIELLILILMIIAISFLLTNLMPERTISKQEFFEAVNNYECEFEELPSQEVKEYYFCTNDNDKIYAHYMYIEDKISNYQESFYNQVKEQYNVLFTTYTEVNNYYAYYSLSSNNIYYVTVRNGKSLIIVTTDSNNIDAVDKIFEDLNLTMDITSVLLSIIPIFIFVIIIYIAAWYSIFKKMGYNKLISIIPIINILYLSYKLFDKKWKILLYLIPFYNIYVLYKFYVELFKRFGINDSYPLLSLFFPIVTLQIIAYDNSKCINEYAN